MFQQLAPLLRQRSVLLTVTVVDDDQIRVNVLPKKLAEGENAALTTPMSFTGTAAELDAQLPDAIVSFVASHLELKNTLDRAKEAMAAAGKAARAEALAKARANTAKKEPPTPEVKPAGATKPAEIVKPEPPKTASLFDVPIAIQSDSEEEESILADTEEQHHAEEDEDRDQVA